MAIDWDELHRSRLAQGRGGAGGRLRPPRAAVGAPRHRHRGHPGPRGRRSRWPCPRGASRRAAPASRASRARASRATCSRSSTTATSSTASSASRRTSRCTFPWDEPDDPAALRAFAADRGPHPRHDEFEHVRGPARPGAVVQVRQPVAHRPRPSASRPSPTICTASTCGLALGATRALGLDRRRRQLPGPAARRGGRSTATSTACARIYAAPAAGLAAVHRAQAVRAGVLLDGRSTTGASATTAPASSGDRGVLAGGLRPSRAERERRDDRRPPHPVREARRLPLQRQPVRRRRPRRRLDQAVPALPGVQRAGRGRGGGRGRVRSVLHARPVAQRDRPDRVADDERHGGAARGYVQACLVDREALRAYQERNDAIMALARLKQAFTTDVAPILAMARRARGGAIDPVAVYRGERVPAGGSRKNGRRRRDAAPASC